MKSFSEWLILENNWRNNPELNKVQVMGWSLSTGTLPPWGSEHDGGLNPTSVFEGRSGPGKGGWEVYQASKPIRADRRNGENILNYLLNSIKLLRTYARARDPNRIRNIQYALMTGKKLEFRENAPEDFVAPDVGGGPDGKGSGSQPSGISGTPNQPSAQSSKQVSAQPQQSQTNSKVVTCPHCKKQFSV
jgi:hypothetical protein